MKNVKLAQEDACPCRNSKTKLTAVVTLLGFAFMLAPRQSQAANLLINPGFETNQNAHVIPQGWTRFAPPTAQGFGNYWCEGAVPAHSGVSYFKEWGACYNTTNNVAGIYQDFSSAPGSVYTANGWFYTGSDTLGADCATWFQVEFLGASSNLLALYKSDNFNSGAGLSTWLQYTVNN